MKHRELGIATFSLLVLWQIFAMILHQPILPSPMTVAVVFWEELGNGLLIHFAASLWRVVAGIGLSLLLAVPAGLVLGQSQKWNRIFSPFLYLIYPIPKVVFVPIVFLLFGIGDLAKITLIFLILFFQVLVLVRDAAVGISPQLLLSLRSLGAGRRALFRFVYLPASIPAILTGLRQSIGTAVAILY
ncbi:MAG TPA: ABC transporter permease, partial [Anaerolineaceae bacterium]|nr:ABC transporter permease [Anaerolineaceae bacterium]